MLIFGFTFTAILLGIILLGAYKAWKFVTHLLSKPFHQAEERHVKTGAFVVIGVTILLMVAPLLIPTVLGFKEFIGALYMIYGGTAIYQIYEWFNSHFSIKSKNDKNGK